MIGLGNKEVALVEYTEEWNKLFLLEKENLSHLLKGYYREIQHVGSTSIPDMPSKPIIDIAVGIDSMESILTIKEILIKNEYFYCENAGDYDRIFFAKGSEDKRTHNIHVELINGYSWNNHIVFRNILLSCPDEAAQYKMLKNTLANKFYNNRKAYTEAKNDFIQSVLKKER